MSYLTDIISSSFVKLAASFAVLLIGIVLTRFIVKLTQKIIKGSNVNKFIQKKLKISLSIEKSLSNIIKYILYIIVTIVALNQLGITKIVLYLIAILIIITFIVYFILSVKGLIPNFMAGIYILKNKKVKKNSNIQYNTIKGIIKNISLTKTKIITKEKDIITIPNSIIKKEMKNIKIE